jgi:hypothetical protein
MDQTRTTRSIQLLRLILGVCIGGSLFGATPTYKVTVLSLPPGSNPRVTGINNLGQVVGYDASTGALFVVTAAGFTPIPLPSGFHSNQSIGGINDSGQTPGTAYSSSDFMAFIAAAGRLAPIPLLPGWKNGFVGTPYPGGINNSGQTVGGALDSSRPLNQCWDVLFIGTVSGVTPVPLPPNWQSDHCGLDYLTDINDAGQVIGVGYKPALGLGGVLLFGTADGVLPISLPTPLYTPFGPFIKKSGQVVANFYVSPPIYVGDFPKFPATGTANALAPVPLPPGYTYSGIAYGANDLGQIVGIASSSTGSDVPFVGTASGTVNLNELVIPFGGRVYGAYAINNKGQIAADGLDPSGVLSVLLLDPLTSVDQVKMFDSHTLQVDVTAQFSQNASTPKSITVNTTINGVPLQSIYPLTFATGTQSKSLFIDFDGVVKVPRFTDNQVFDVTATVTENGAVVGTATKTGAEIPLPVVHVHGVITDCTTNPFPTDLFTYLNLQHPSYTIDKGTGTFSGIRFATPSYPTLVSFPYKSLTQSADTSALDLVTWIHFELLPSTWASKVDIVAHSLGGIVSRSAVWHGGSSMINKVILVGSPSNGSTWAPIFLSNWGLVKTLNDAGSPITQAILAAWATFGVPVANILPTFQQVASVGACVGAGGDITTRQLLPIYRWLGKDKASTDQGQLLPIELGYVNPLLPSLNLFSLHPDVRYYAVVAGAEKHTLSRAWGKFLLPGFFVPYMSDPMGFDYGDGIVTLDSQLGMGNNWPLGTARGQLNINRLNGTLRDVGAVLHTDYFKSPLAQQDIEQILWKQ